MTAFNFKPEFVTKIESGEKNQTIRQTKRCEVGDAMQLYTGQRTKQCRKIADAVCTDVFPIEIGNSGILYFDPKVDIQVFAENDGFQSAADMYQFFKSQYGIPFHGYVHKWRLK